MFRLDKVIKPWKESAALNDHINLLGFWNNGYLKVVGYTPQSQVSMFVASTAMPVPAATPASAFL
jgi:hypothetical protein